MRVKSKYPIKIPKHKLKLKKARNDEGKKLSWIPKYQIRKNLLSISQYFGCNERERQKNDVHIHFKQHKFIMQTHILWGNGIEEWPIDFN